MNLCRGRRDIQIDVNREKGKQRDRDRELIFGSMIYKILSVITLNGRT